MNACKITLVWGEMGHSMYLRQWCPTSPAMVLWVRKLSFLSKKNSHSSNTVFQRPGFESRWRYMFFTSAIKVAFSWRMPLRVAPEGVLT